MNDVERRYRRLLRWYPRDHRERNGEEMLGVLLADARDRERPGRRETLDLLWGAARLHLRRIVGVDGGFDRRDVLAILSLLAPVLMLAAAEQDLYVLGAWLRGGGWVTSSGSYLASDAALWAIWLAVAVLAVVGMRRVAAVGAWLGTAGFVQAVFVELQDTWSFRLWTTMNAGWVLLGALTAVALTWSPGPARGRELVGRWSMAVLATSVAVPLLFGLLDGWTEDTLFTTAWEALLALGVLFFGALVAAGPWSRVGRRAGLMLLLPAMTFVPVVVAQAGLVPHFMYSLSVFEATIIEAAVFAVVPVLVVLLALGVIPRAMRRGRRPVA
jgi:hypothetical protein